MEKIHLFPVYTSREDYETRTGRACPPYDPTRHVKRWEDPDALMNPSTAVYEVLRIDTSTKCIVVDDIGNPCFEKMALPSTEAFRVNIPASAGTDPSSVGEIRMPCRSLNAEWREILGWIDDKPAVSIKALPADPMQQVIDGLKSLDTRMRQQATQLAEVLAGISDLQQVVGKRKGVDEKTKV
jgi:hypothetical protein